MKFCLLNLLGPSVAPTIPEFAFFLYSVADLHDSSRRFHLSGEEIRRINANSGTCPVFRSSKDAELVAGIHNKYPILIEEREGEDINPWGLSFLPTIDVSNESTVAGQEELEEAGWVLEGNRFTKSGGTCLPVYEAKMAVMWDHRAANVVISDEAVVRHALSESLTTEEHQDPECLALPRFWVPEEVVEARYKGRWTHKWFLVWRDITSPSNERSVLAMILPYSGPTATCRLASAHVEEPKDYLLLLGNINSFAFDYITRQKLGGIHVTNSLLKQIPCIPPIMYRDYSPGGKTSSGTDWISDRVLELSYTAWDLEDFARDCGYDGPPYSWDEDRRRSLRCELDAAYFHLYGIERGDVIHILETFPVVKRRDIARTEVKDAQGEVTQEGTYITKDTILSIYDAMQQAIDSGQPYQTLLDPPPADPAVAHSARSKEAVPGDGK